MNSTKVSVIIPAYNEENYLPQCLKALKNQEEPADEIIVVDNNSTDKTANIAREFNTILVREKKRGMIPARNLGFNTAKYSILARIDADTIVPSDWIKIIKEDFSLRKIAGLTGPCCFYDFSTFFLLNKIAGKIQYVWYFKLLQKMTGCNLLWGSNMAIPKHIWDLVKNEACMNDKQIHEDMDLSIHIAKYGTIKLDPKLYTSVSLRRITYLSSLGDYFIFKLIRTIKHGRELRN